MQIHLQIKYSLINHGIINYDMQNKKGTKKYK